MLPLIIVLFVHLLLASEQIPAATSNELQPRFGFVAIAVIEELAETTRTVINNNKRRQDDNSSQFQRYANQQLRESVRKIDLLTNSNRMDVNRLESEAALAGKVTTKCQTMMQTASNSGQSCKLQLTDRKEDEALAVSRRVCDFATSQDRAKRDVDRIVDESKRFTFDCFRLRHSDELKKIKARSDRDSADLTEEIDRVKGRLTFDLANIVSDCKAAINGQFAPIINCYLTLKK